MKKALSIFLAAALAASTLAGCGQASGAGAAASTASSTSQAPQTAKAAQTSAAASTSAAATAAAAADTSSLKLDNAKWNFDSDNQVYWQIGLSYCTSPEDTTYETMGIYVPAAYMTGKDNGDGTYTCTVNKTGTVGSFSAADAPMVLPVETPGYAAMASPTAYDYSTVSDYLKAGYIFLQAGCRGNHGSMGHAGMAAGSENTVNNTTSGAQSSAPWGVTDLKAAIRYVRYNASSLPGDSARIFSYGMSGGGAQSSLLGASGDSSLYTPYLNKIGAAMTDASGSALSDAVYGSMCWCPVTSLNIGDEAYEWMMGQYATSDTRADGTFTAALSKDMATVFADYINKLGLTDEKGNALTLSKSDSGIYCSGTYYDYIKSVVEQSLNNFLSDTTFPYTPKSQGGFAGGKPGGGKLGGGMQGNPPAGAPSDGNASAAVPSPAGVPDTAQNNAARGAEGSQSSTTYNTVQDYIDYLNGDTPWITYDAVSNTATISSLEAFAKNCKKPTKSVCAFDSLDLSTAENSVFSDASNTPEHFDSYVAELLKSNQSKYSSLSGWKDSYVTDYQGISSVKDELSTTTDVRQNMYDPLYFLTGSSKGSGSSKVAQYWRIRTGIFQGDTSLSTETNLALALQKQSSVKNVDFATVWGMYHVTAERTGDSTGNFISWVAQCCGK